MSNLEIFQNPEPEQEEIARTLPQTDIPATTAGPSDQVMVEDDAEFVDFINEDEVHGTVLLEEGSEAEEEIEEGDFLKILPKKMGEKSTEIICPLCDQSKVHKPNCTVSYMIT